MLTSLIPITDCPNQSSAEQPDCVARLIAALQEDFTKSGLTAFHYGCGKAWTKEDVFYSRLISTFDVSWLKDYLQHQWYRYDPIHRAIIASKSSFSFGYWHDAYNWAENHPIGDNRSEHDQYKRMLNKFILRARDSGLIDGVYLSYSTKSTNMQLSLACDHFFEAAIGENEIKRWIANMHLANLILERVDDCPRCAYSKVARHDILKEIRLTTAERNVLKIFKENPSANTRQIAKLYNSSEATVNYHLRNIRDKFGQPETSGHVLASFAESNNLL